MALLKGKIFFLLTDQNTTMIGLESGTIYIGVFHTNFLKHLFEKSVGSFSLKESEKNNLSDLAVILIHWTGEWILLAEWELSGNTVREDEAKFQYLLYPKTYKLVKIVHNHCSTKHRWP